MAGNADAGRSSIAQINKKSLYLREFCKPAANGRKPLAANELFDFSRENQIGFTFVDKSKFILLPLIYPPMFFNNDDPLMRHAIKGFMNYICTMTREVSGFSNHELGVQKPEMRSKFFKVPMFTQIDNPTEELTFTIPAELDSYFLTTMIRIWQNAISDEYSGVAHYLGYKDDFNNYTHSAAFAYIKPNKTYTKVDWGCLIYMAVPLNCDMSIMDANATNPEVPEVSIRWSCSILDNRTNKIDEVLTSLLLKWGNIIVKDSADYGTINRTHLSLVDEVNEDLIFGNIVVG